MKLNTPSFKLLTSLFVMLFCFLQNGYAETTINMLAPERMKSYQKGGLTHSTIIDFFNDIPGYSVSFKYMSFSEGWRLINEGYDLCHFYGVSWPTDENVIHSKKYTLRMRSPQIIINRDVLTKKGYKAPFDSVQILSDKTLFGVTIRDFRFEYRLYKWLQKQILKESDHIITADFSIDVLYSMLSKQRFDYLILSPDTAVYLGQETTENIVFIPLDSSQKKYNSMKIICNDNVKNNQFIVEADNSIDNLYQNKDWLTIWRMLNYFQEDKGKSSLEDFKALNNH